jgi:hypothetical protein
LSAGETKAAPGAQWGLDYVKVDVSSETKLRHSACRIAIPARGASLGGAFGIGKQSLPARQRRRIVVVSAFMLRRIID